MKNLKEEPVYLGWMHSINLQNQFCSPSHVESILGEVVKIRTEIDSLKTSLHSGLCSMFPVWSVKEWMQTHFYPLANEVKSLEGSLDTLFKKNTFPVRPLKISDTASTTDVSSNKGDN